MEENNIRGESLTWDEYFMSIANLVKLRSKDPITKVGACIVKDNKILSTGYNGFPKGLSNEDYPWTKGNSDETKNKFYYVVHAELNAIINADNSIKGSTLYVTKFPCNECAKAIIQSDISKVIYLSESSDEKLSKKFLIVSKMLKDANIEVLQYINTFKEIKIIT